MPAVDLRPASDEDAGPIADVYLAARRAAVPAIPPLVHPDDAVRSHLAALLADHDVVVAEHGGHVVGFVACRGGWMAHLYVHPDHTGGGIGSKLVLAAKAGRSQIDLWCFQSNTRARRFYARFGFREVERTDGDNEEGAPDVRLRWADQRSA